MIVGELYAVTLPDAKIGVFQYLGKDRSQLNSDVIRVFAEKFENIEAASSANFANLTDDFFTHTSVRIGEKVGKWRKIGRHQVAPYRIQFRQSADQGNPEVRFSVRWYVWCPNQDKQFVGELNGETRAAEIGWVVNPTSLIERMHTGLQTHFYPEG